MSALEPRADVVALRDGSSERPIPTCWRPVLRRIANAFAQGDFALTRKIPNVAAISPEKAAQFQASIAGYGATLADLPEQSWESSVCIWYGMYWDALVDLWTEEEGRSDLVMNVRITEAEDEFKFDVHMVYVP